MRKPIAMAALLVLLGSMGCVNFNPDVKVESGGWGSGWKRDGKTGDSQESTSGKEMFQGHYITVWIDGDKTKLDGKKNNEQVWKVDSPSSNPKVKFKLDTGKLGKFKQVDIIINPVRGGKVDHGAMYKPDGMAGMRPGKEVRLKEFAWFHDGKYEKVRRIPAGEYYITVQVNGDDSWDRQFIRAEIK